ncbi:Ubiquitin-conjugating enzyme E2 4 [Vanrija pseudolonga]|uniref:E2 ubiquitin-conjugating enzyme n=1 Tax=Vanrija pseudolonga TaxID=143232 RepID=A0AAF0XZX6_9TREE|nr:Ubiquitin-conjugating enzyme E2 4 [Vanrija pseudolonga]
MSSAGTRRIQKELSELLKTPLEGISVAPNGDNIHTWKVVIKGPAGTPYAGGKFGLTVEFGDSFPFKPPTVGDSSLSHPLTLQVTFSTKIYHTNVDTDGNICIAVLKPDVWKPATKIASVLLAIQDLLDTPNPDDPLVASIADQYRNDRKAFDQKATEYTKKYAV